jgi:serine/threonine protein kinase/tetratricopeptide (TPR) repeat protein
MIGDQIQHYRIIRQLGAGGMGVVYEAEDTRLGRRVALKFLPDSAGLSPAALERFEREGRTISQLTHPNICTLYDVGVDAAQGGRQFLVMELLDGEPLNARIHGEPLPVDQVVDVGCQIADALDFAHAHGIVHRDIKPANILITRRGQAKLLDFGVAKVEADGPPATGDTATKIQDDVLTAPGSAIGSVNYMSPEQARGETIDGRSDLFSLGLVLYEMATGRQAFAGKTTAVVFDAILNRQPPPPRALNPALPDDLDRTISRTLEKDRRLRYQTAADLLAELSRIRRDSGSRTASLSHLTAAHSGAAPEPVIAPNAGATPASGSPSAAPTPRAASRGRLWAPVAAGLLIAGGAGWYLWRTTQKPTFAERDSVVIADFVNTTGDTVFDDALRQAVSVQLQQTPFVTLLSDQTVQRTLALMQRKPDEPLTGAVAREVCQRAGAKATVEGSIAPLGSSYVLTLGVHNCQTGAALAEQQLQATSKEDVLKVIDHAVAGIRQHMGESLASIQKYDVPVTDATTASLDALRAYGLATRTRVLKGDEAAVPFYQQAVEDDPNFAMADAKLAVIAFNSRRVDDAQRFAAKAYALRGHVSEYERLYITWTYAASTNNQKLVLDTLELMTTAYPNDYAARQNLGVYYVVADDFDKAVEQFSAAGALAPDEPLTFTAAAQANLALDRRQQAYQAGRAALRLRPNGGLASALWVAARLAGDQEAAEFETDARKMASAPDVRDTEAGMARYYGKIDEYDRIESEVVSARRAQGDEPGAERGEANVRITDAIYRGPKALGTLESDFNRERNPEIIAREAAVLAPLGVLPPVRARLREIEAASTKDEGLRAQATIAKAFLSAADGHVSDGISQVSVVASGDQPELFFFIGRLRQQSDDLKGAIGNYRMTVGAGGALALNPVLAITRLELGELLARTGDAAGAKAQFDALSKEWAQADAGLDIVQRLHDDATKLGH